MSSTATTDAVRQRTGDASGPELPRLALSIKEAADAISVSESHFKRHVLPGIRVTLSGGRRLVMVRELERYLTEQAV